MKKIFALLAVVLGVVSCQTEPEGLDVNVGGEQEVAICVSLPEATRANVDSALGAFANVDLGTEDDNNTIRYILKIYQKVGENYVASTDRQVEYSDEKSVVFPVRLVPNRDYRFVVWADYVENKNDIDLHYNTHNEGELANITLNDTWFAMDETRDAFTGYFDTVDERKQYTSTSSINITLKRPFAKLRVITTDMKELGYLGINPAYATVEYKTAYRAGFNAFDSVAVAANDSDKKTHTVFQIASYGDNVTTGDKQSKVLFTDYFFAEDDVVKFTLSVYEDEAMTKPIKSNFFNTDIAAKRNYLTTIQGNILTDGNNITVEVKDAFENANNPTDEPYYYQTISSEAELLAAINNGGEYVVISDIEVNGLSISAQAATRSGVTTTINLNGYTINLQENIVIPEGKTVIINNDPVDDAGNDKGEVVNAGGKIVNNGTLNIEGGEFGANTIENNGSANVSGGNFEDNAIVNNGSVSVEGDNSGEEDRIIVNDGEDAVVTNIVYTVKELQDALDKGKVDEITFGADLVGDATISQREGVNVYINGDDKKFDGTIKIYGNSRYTGAETILIKNVNFETETSKDFIWSDNGQVSEMRYAHKITVEGCTFNGVEGQAIVGMRLRQAYNVIVKDCQAYNVHSLVQNASAHGLKIDNVYVEGLTGINIPSSGNVEISNSTIIASEENGFAVRGDGSNPGSMKISGCTFTADRPVIVRNLKSTYNLAFEGTNHLNNNKIYDVILTNGKDNEAYVAPTGTYTLTGADDYIVFPREYAVKNVEQIAEALTLKSKVLFANDIEGDVYIPQQEKFNVVIDGRGYKFDGTFTIDGQNRNDGAETLTLKNINFYTESTDEKTFISCPSTYNGVNERYSHNVTIDGCTFKASTLTDKVGAISAQKTYHLAVKNCEAYNIHSLLQVQSCDNDVTVEKVKVENCISGISVGNTNITNISNANIKTKKYGIRLDGETSRKVTVNVANSNIEAYIPIVARKVSTGCNVDVNLSETTLVQKNNDMLDVVFQSNKDYEDGNVTPVAPTGNWKITGADDYIVYPRNYAGSQAELETALKNSDIKNIVLGADITVTEKWDNRFNGAKVTRPITINGNGKTLKFACNVSDNNYMSAFRFEAPAVVENLTIDMSEIANKAAAISTKGNINVDKCTFIGSTTYTGCRGIRFGEGAGTAVSDIEVSVTNSTFTNLGRGITDNENGQDAKSVTICNNVCTNATVNVSAHDSIVFTGNTMSGSQAIFVTYTKATDAKVVAINNTLDLNLVNYTSGFAAANVECQEGFTIYK